MTTWMHAANEKHKLRAPQHKTQHTWTGERTAEQTRDRTLTQQDRTWSASVQTLTRNQNSRHECRDPNTTLQHETRHTNESAHGSSTLEAARSHENRTWRECQDSVTKPWITLDRSDRTPTDLFTYLLVFQISSNYFNLILIYLFICLLVCILVFQMSSNYFN